MMMERCYEGVKKQVSGSAVKQLLVLVLVMSISPALCAPETSPGTVMSKEQLSQEEFNGDIDKRAAPRQYGGFGLGKKSEDWSGEEQQQRLAELLDDPSAWESYISEDKRAEPSRFGFGLGKREPLSSFGRVYALPWKKANRFAFGLGKRMVAGGDEDFMKRRYSFGLGKRAGARYVFGLGR